MDLRIEKIDRGKMLLASDDIRKSVGGLNAWIRHLVYHQTCQSVAPVAPVDPGSDTPAERLTTTGFHQISSDLDNADIGALTGVIDDALGDAKSEGEPGKELHAVDWTPERRQIVAGLLGKMITPEVRQMLEGYFGTHFRILSLNMARLFPLDFNPVSFQWHRDMEPAQQTHLMVYLTDGTIEAGSTSFMSLDDSRRAAENGYGFPNAAQRTASIEDLSERSGHELTAHSPEIQKGDIMAFAATRVLHKGNVPKTGHRDVITLLVLPSPIPWDEYFQAWPDVFVQNHPGLAGIEPFEGTRLNDTGKREVPPWAILTDMMPS